MGKNQCESLGALNRQDVFFFDPEALTIIQDDPKHPLYNQRPKAPSEATVRDIIAHGIHSPIKVRRSGAKNADGTPVLEVVFGTQRVRAARLANQWIQTPGSAYTGCELVRVPATVTNGDDKKAMGLMISENEHRTDSSPLSRAHLAARFLEHGASEDECCMRFNITIHTLRYWQQLLQCCEEVQQAVENGIIPACVAKELHALDHDAQRKALAEMIEAGATRGSAAVAAAQRAAKGKPAKPMMRGTKMRSRKLLDRAISELSDLREDKSCALALYVLMYVRGSDAAIRQMPEQLREALKSVAPKRAKINSKKGQIP